MGDAVTVTGRVQEFRPGGAGGAANLTTTEIAVTASTRDGHGHDPPDGRRPGRPQPAARVIEDDGTGDVEARLPVRPPGGRARLPREPRGHARADRAARRSSARARPTASSPWSRATRRAPHAARRRPDPPGRLQPGADHPRRRARRAAGGERRRPPRARGGGRGLLVRQLQVRGHLRAGAHRPRAAARGHPGAARERARDRLDERREPQRADSRRRASSPGSPTSSSTTSARPTSWPSRRCRTTTARPTSGDHGRDRDVQAASSRPIAAAGGPHYEYRQIDPVHDEDGGEPGGNIRVGFLFRTDRGLASSTAPAATRPRDDRGPGPAGRAADAQPRPRSTRRTRRGTDSRKPLVGEFQWRGQDGVRDREPLQLQGRRPAAVRALPAARAGLGGAAPPAGALLRDFVRSLLRRIRSRGSR